MKLKFVGHLCPECGGECQTDSFYTGRAVGQARKRRETSGFLGYHYWSCCYRCHLAYLLLFDQDRRFIGIVPNGHLVASEHEGTMYQAGRRDFEADEIPF